MVQPGFVLLKDCPKDLIGEWCRHLLRKFYFRCITHSVEVSFRKSPRTRVSLNYSFRNITRRSRTVRRETLERF